MARDGRVQNANGISSEDFLCLEYGITPGFPDAKLPAIDTWVDYYLPCPWGDIYLPPPWANVPCSIGVDLQHTVRARKLVDILGVQLSFLLALKSLTSAGIAIVVRAVRRDPCV